MSDNQNLEHEVRSLRAELATVRSEQAKAEAIRAAVASRGAADPVAVEQMVAGLTRPNAAGDLVAVDEAGAFRFGQGPGAYMPITELVDELSRKSPELFNPGKGAPVEKNPFLPGPNWNFTEIMRIWKTDPERAEHLEYLAGIGKSAK